MIILLIRSWEALSPLGFYFVQNLNKEEFGLDLSNKIEVIGGI